MPAERSFLGPKKPSWIDLRRRHALRDLERATLRRISALEALPQSSAVRQELEREKAHLEAVRREEHEAAGKNRCSAGIGSGAPQ
jgi:hypothetical protein